MSFFDTTPLGRLINRFSKDVDTLDNVLPWSIRSWLMCFVTVCMSGMWRLGSCCVHVQDLETQKRQMHVLFESLIHMIWNSLFLNILYIKICFFYSSCACVYYSYSPMVIWLTQPIISL
ncbi:Canalicular multispecific organic anion transporter 1 [Portunus trituberculatus]|uniref:Canalicular multispecific organic anion transporter 1 n=1 Tax=Portunus trituberculatus TaxID=210409 RepID=A0A5B7JXI0_PORTR|nr:Canalicular multispecific organic anion transporter 1 [Portunus trituberculatus]